MATNTLYSTYCRSGYLSSDGYSYTSDWTFGEQSGHNFKGVVRFPDLLLRSAVIQNISLVLRRIDTYGGRTCQFGFNQNIAWGSTLLRTFSVSISSGTGNKTIDLTAHKDLIQNFSGEWCIHTNRDGNASGFTQFNGDEDGTNGPRIVVTYENATVEYFTAGAWQKCLVHYRTSTGWVQTIPYIYKSGVWVQV